MSYELSFLLRSPDDDLNTCSTYSPSFALSTLCLDGRYTCPVVWKTYSIQFPLRGTSPCLTSRRTRKVLQDDWPDCRKIALRGGPSTIPPATRRFGHVTQIHTYCSVALITRMDIRMPYDHLHVYRSCDEFCSLSAAPLLDLAKVVS